MNVVNLPVEHYSELSNIELQYKLDFDDAYQTAVAQVLQLTIVTMDNDFKKVAKNQSVIFL